MKEVRWLLGEMCNHIGITFRHISLSPASGKGDCVVHYVKTVSWVTKCKELMPWFDPWKPRFLTCCNSAKEGLHRFVEAEKDFLQELSVHVIYLGIDLPAFPQRFLGVVYIPSFPIA